MGDDWKPLAPLQHLRKPRQSGVTRKQKYLDSPKKGVFALSEEDGKIIILLLKQLQDDADIFENGTHSSI